MTKSQASERITTLRKQIMLANYAYYDLSKKIMSNEEYDSLYAELISLTSQYPQIAERLPYNENFKETIMYRYSWVEEQAKRISSIE